MVIPEFGNALPQLGHNTAKIVGPEARKDTYKRKILSWIGTSTVSLLYDLAGGSACRRGPCDLHCISPLISLSFPHLSSLVRQSDLCSRPVHT